jgi:colanic acid/amylovoran biosynthesis glycosyltransferase
VVCVPSVPTADGNAEGLPTTLVEAQASGVPVVASPSGGTAEGVVDGVTGLLAPSGDERALAAALIELLGDRTLRDRCAAAARAHALERFDLRRQTAALERIYDEVVEAGGWLTSPGSR